MGVKSSFRKNSDSFHPPLILSPPGLDGTYGWGGVLGFIRQNFLPLAAPAPRPAAIASSFSWPPSGLGVLECAENSDRGSSLVRLNWCDLMAFLADSDLYGFLSCKSAF